MCFSGRFIYLVGAVFGCGVLCSNQLYVNWTTSTSGLESRDILEKNNVSLSKAIQLKLRAIRNLVRQGTLVLFFDHGKCHLAFISLCWDIKPQIAFYLLCLTRLRPSWGSQWCQQSTSMRFQFREEGAGGWGGFSGLINFAVYSWERILRPPGLGLPFVRWYRAYAEIRSSWRRWRQWPRNLICQALTDWEMGLFSCVKSFGLSWNWQ